MSILNISTSQDLSHNFEVTIKPTPKVDKEKVMALRRKGFGKDSWEEIDNLSHHLLLTDSVSGELIGYYRIVDWADIEHDLSLSPLVRVYAGSEKIERPSRVVEFGRLCTAQDEQSLYALRLMWKALFHYGASKGPDTFGLGMVTLDDTEPQQAANMFGVAQTLAKADDLDMLTARKPLPPAAELDLSKTKKARKQLTPLMRCYLAIGAKFGPAATWETFGNRPCVIVKFTEKASARLKHV